MRMLHRFDGPKPQVVGLTASLPLGAGRANVEAALDVCFFQFNENLLITLFYFKSNG